MFGGRTKVNRERDLESEGNIGRKRQRKKVRERIEESKQNEESEQNKKF